MEFLGLVFALTAGLWGLLFVRQAGVWGLAMVALISSVMLGYDFFHASILTIDRVLIGISLLALGVALCIGKARWNPLSRQDLLFLFFIAMMVLNTFIHDWKANEQASIGRLLFYYLLPAGYYVLARLSNLGTKQIRMFLAVLALMGLYLSLTAVAERLELRWAVFPRYIMDPRYEEFLGRARGPLLNPSGNGVLLAIGFSAFLMTIGWVTGVSRRLLLSMIPIFGIGFAATLTRCVWLAGLIPLIGIVLILVPTNIRRPMVAILAIGLIGMVGLSAQKLSGFKRDKNVSVSEMKQSAELRPILAVIAFRMFEDHPLVGCGLANYTTASRPYFAERHHKLILDKGRPYVQHNIFLSLLTEVGLLGLVPFTIALLVWSKSAWRLWASRHLPLEVRQLGLVFLGGIQGFIVIGMFQDVMIIPAINIFLFFLAGCVVNATQRAAQHGWETDRSQSVPAVHSRRSLQPA